MLILQGVGGLGQRLGMLILWGRERGVGGQILGILYFGRDGSVRGVCGQTLGMLITGRARGGSETDIGLFILLGAGEFWARDWGC